MVMPRFPNTPFRIVDDLTRAAGEAVTSGARRLGVGQGSDALQRRVADVTQRGRLPEFPTGREVGGPETPPAGAGGGDDFLSLLRKSYTNVFSDAQGRMRAFDPTSGDWLTFVQDADGNWVMEGDKPKAAGGGGDGSSWARLALDQERFAFEKQQYDQDFTEGKRRFELEFSESQFRDRRDYDQARDQFAQTFAEEKRQFDVTEGRMGKQLEQQESQFGRTEGRLTRQMEQEGALEEKRLGLEGELGRGRLDVDRERLGVERESKAREAMLAESRFKAEVLRNPSDYIYRAFESRGATAPTARITQADLINGLQRFAGGGSTQARMMVVGEEGPELIHNPEQAPLEIANNDQTEQMMQGGRMQVPGYADGTTPDNPFAGTQMWDSGSYSQGAPVLASPTPSYPSGPTAEYDSGAPTQSTSRSLYPGLAPGSMLGPNHYWQSLPADFDYGPQEQPQGGGGGGGGRFNLGSGGMQQPSRFGLDQATLMDLVRRFSPPAVSAALAGTRIPSWRAASPGLTPQRLAQLSPGELAAMNSRLGVEFNTTLEDELAGLMSLFGPSVSRPRARMVG